MTATIMFITNYGQRWQMTKQFNNEQHLNNFIKYICKTKNYMLDEVYKSINK